MNEVYLRFLRRTNRLIKLDISENEITNLIVRASQDCECEKCGLEYKNHPYLENSLDSEGYPYLHVICTGLIVKL